MPREGCAASDTIQNGAWKRMSLKAKLEAVIYAAEEPVTLAQLAVLFADEAQEWKAAQAAAMAAAAAASIPPVTGDVTAMPLLGGALAYLEVAEGNESADETDDDEPAENPSPEQQAEGASGEIDDKPVPEADAIKEAKQRDREARAVIRQVLAELVEDYAAEGRGIEVREIAGGYRMATKPEFHDAVRSFVKSLKPPLKLSLPALETLAVIAYKQPVTAPEVNEIRGVDSSGVFGSLLARKLIAAAGRKQVVGRPILYKTTREFLLRFGLKDVSELPSMEEFEKMAASELEDTEVAPQEPEAEAQAPEEFNADPNLERDEAEAVAPEASQSESNS
jgi:segregation and condensation protein B